MVQARREKRGVEEGGGGGEAEGGVGRVGWEVLGAAMRPSVLYFP